ncbi:MAG: GNAT family N-acetyltransferase [Candidatus Cloacimonadaceae bacterium]
MIKIEKLDSVTNPADFEQLLKLYLSNHWIEAADDSTDALIEKIVASTFCFAVARDGDTIIAMGRAISDGVSDAYIQDVTVLPEYRKQGIGGLIIDFLVDCLHSHGIEWIGLISEPGYESFYQNLGFGVMPGYTPFLYKGKP